MTNKGKNICNLCNNIKKIEEYKEMDTWDRNNAIVQKKNKSFGIWIECEDWYYSGVAMEINYCPICGRKLNDS